MLIGVINISNTIHETSIINSSARIGNNVNIGPFSIIENDTIIGDGTSIGSNAVIKEYTTIGTNCKIFQGAILGEIPQDLKFNNEYSELVIGNNTIIREYTTLNRGTDASGKTIIGNNVLLMAYVHVGHDCVIGDQSIIANSVQIGGHVIIGSNATIGGSTPIHQFCKIGDYAFIGGGFRIVQDVPPYILAAGEPLKFNGINSIGLRRKKFTLESRKNIKKTYKYIYKSNLNITNAIEKINDELSNTTEVKKIINFISDSDRGIIF